MVKLVIIKRIAASTLLEVLISMIIILVVFSSAMLIFNNVMRMSLSQTRLQAEAMVKKTMSIIERADNKNDQIIRAGDFTLEVNVLPDSLSDDLKIINITAFDHNHNQLAHQIKLIVDDKRPKD